MLLLTPTETEPKRPRFGDRYNALILFQGTGGITSAHPNFGLPINNAAWKGISGLASHSISLHATYIRQ